MVLLYIFLIILILILIYFLYKQNKFKETFSIDKNKKLNKEDIFEDKILTSFIDQIIIQSNILEKNLLYVNMCNNCISKYFFNISVLHSEALSYMNEKDINIELIKNSAVVYSDAFDEFLNSNNNKDIIDIIIIKIQNIKMELMNNRNNKFKIILNNRNNKVSEFHKDILPLPNPWYI